ncbi:MAG: DUF1080 domain-containing protein [Phycisphaeraceae bacterium]|nr:MAG: DUF1080 domain-containing protein [Phycisphaeraceae bacterium]
MIRACKVIFLIACFASSSCAVGPNAERAEGAVKHNVLSDAERESGWRLLFDGESLEHFRGYRKAEMPEIGWRVKDGTLWRPPGQGGGDIVTREQFRDFEFVCDWKVSPRGNSGIIYRCTEDHAYSWETGLEMQILDDAGHGDGLNPKTRAGSLYDLFPAPEGVVRPAGEWNTARIVARGTRVQHWLNGEKIVDVDILSPEFKAAWKDSKWPNMPNFATRLRGHIALQDHGDEVWFRNIKIREIQ